MVEKTLTFQSLNVSKVAIGAPDDLALDGDMAKQLGQEMEAAIMKAVGTPAKRRQTALRLISGRSFETVELDDEGNVIEPRRCNCGSWAIVHRPSCLFSLACN